MNSINIYTNKITPRLQYACNIVFKTILNTDYELVTEVEDSSKIDVNYSSESLNSVFQIVPSGILERTGVSDHEILAGEYESIKTLFHTGKGSIPFDIFSAVFYMCSRYEEYLPFEPDEHGRYKIENSVAYRYNFVEDPIVEFWVQKLADKLKLEYPKSTYKTQLTIDVDDAWKYKNRPRLLNLGKLIRSLISFKFKELGFQLAVHLNKKNDPWYTFPYLSEIEERFKLSIQYFFLIGRKSPYDKAISLRKKQFRKLIADLEKKKKVGIHPSYASHFTKKLLQKEFYALAGVNTSKPLQSRQHFLMVSFPETFRELSHLGIIEEHTLGWAENIGFRAGISRPFPFYDVLAEKESHIKFVPFMIMDRTIKDYMGLSADEAKIRLEALIDKIKSVGGQFTMLWHNDSVSNYGEWNGWREVFEEALIYAENVEED